jgi:2-C-methyl-D-erythritol 4-phosphate cytidylyltransferase
MKKIALIVAGGKGERMGSDIPKQFLLLNKQPILMHTLRKFSHFDEIILVLASSQFEYWNKLCIDYSFNERYTLVEGGSSRFDSVKNGLSKITKCAIVAIHDAVRPLISKALIDKLISHNRKYVGIIPILAIQDSIREVNGSKSSYADRSKYFLVQTPQCFMSDDIKSAYQQRFSKKFTDDASVLESNGCEIIAVEGDIKNIKITNKEDLIIAAALTQ